MAKRWIQIAPFGEFPHPAGVVQVIDAAAVKAMADSFDPDRKALIDFDHYSDLSNAQKEAVDDAGVALPSEAAGWIEDVEAREDGLYGLANFNRAGERAIGDEKYRFVSPVWLRRDCEAAGEGRLRPMKLSKVGLTNEPNIRVIAPIANREGAEPMAGPMCALSNAAPVENPASIIAPEKAQPQPKGNEMREKLIAALGLDAEATDEQILEAVAAMKNSEAEDEKKAKELENAETEAAKKDEEIEDLKNRLATANKAAIEAKADAVIAEHADKIENREDTRAALLANFDATVKLLNAIKAPAATLPNRADGKLPEGEEKKPTLTGIERTQAAFAAGK
jgi:hypothetical protein